MTWFHNGDVSLPKTRDYDYDGEGRRVQRVSTISGASRTTIYVYDAFGRLAAEYSPTTPETPAGRFFRTGDHLGSTRLTTKSDGAIADQGCRDFFPFGERISSSVGGRSAACYSGGTTGDAFAQKFTAKERDGESELDYFLARYYAGTLGRFNSVDPGSADATLDDPRSWNGYAYVRNSPLTYVDPDGQVVVIAVAAAALGGCAVGTATSLTGRAATLNPGPRTPMENRKLALSAARGCIAGAAGGLAYVTAAPVIIGSVAGAVGLNIALGAAERSLDGDPRTNPFDPWDTSIDFVSGVIGGTPSTVLGQELLASALAGKDSPIEVVESTIVYEPIEQVDSTIIYDEVVEDDEYEGSGTP